MPVRRVAQLTCHAVSVHMHGQLCATICTAGSVKMLLLLLLLLLLLMMLMMMTAPLGQLPVLVLSARDGIYH